MKKINCGLLLFLLLAVVSVAQAQTLGQFSGKIVDEKATPIAGASVRLLNTGKAAVSNAVGEFLLANVESGRYIVQVSAVGFATTTNEVLVAASSKQQTFVLSSTSRVLEQVVVSAQKREEVLQRLPLSVTALNSRQVQEYRLWDLREITGIVPNLYSSDPGDKRNVTSIRGIVTTSYNPAVVTNVDGVSQFNLDTYISPLFDVERIEVLRGPQGTLYGRNAMGGVVNVITRQPTNQPSGFAELSIGNYGQQRYSLGFRAPLVKDKLFVGAAGLYSRTNGFYINTPIDKHYDEQSIAGGNYYLKYLPGKSWDLVLNAKHNNQRNNGPFPLVVGPDEAFKDPFVLSQNATTKMIDNTLNTSLSVTHAGHGFNFSSQTAYQSNYRYYTRPIDADFSPIDGITLNNNFGPDWNKVNVWTQEFRFTNPAASKASLQWTAGAYFFHQDNPTKQATHFGKDAAYVGSPDINYSLISTTKAKSTGEALYAQATYQLTAKLDVIAGLRYDHEKQKQSVLGEYQKDPNPEPLFAYQPDTSATAAFDALSPKFGLALHALASQLLFVTYSRGFRAGGLTPLSSDPSQPALFSFKPEYSSNIEAGMKNVFWGNRLSVNVTAFLSRITDVQVPTLVLPSAVTITRNTGELTSKGFETEINATPFTGFLVAHTFGYTHARFRSFKVSSNGSSVDLKGNRQIFTPDLTSMLALQYSRKLNVRRNISVVLRGEWRYLGTQYFDVANTIRQTPYNLYNARVGINVGKFSAFAWGRNLFDTKYIGYAYDFGAAHLGDPRTYGGTVAMRF